MAIVSFDPDVFGSQINELIDIADDFGQAQARLQSVLSDHWTAQNALNKFESPENSVVNDLVEAFNNIRGSFENLAIDLHAARQQLIEADMISAEDLTKITDDLESLDESIDSIDDVVSPQQTMNPLNGPYATPV
ncbi:hypothetical protein [Flaviflexus massiliensis]|uniref:hypothetical protein n=1 Tax=Flaviflexus massiliensis TaxID=1522309 RepID=UPI0006D57BF5|nr:hypothetical protein [Flaviflexus massiliensis]